MPFDIHMCSYIQRVSQVRLFAGHFWYADRISTQAWTNHLKSVILTHTADYSRADQGVLSRQTRGFHMETPP